MCAAIVEADLLRHHGDRVPADLAPPLGGRDDLRDRAGPGEDQLGAEALLAAPGQREVLAHPFEADDRVVRIAGEGEAVADGAAAAEGRLAEPADPDRDRSAGAAG